MAFPYLEDVIHYYFGVAIWLPLPTFGVMVLLGFLAAFVVFYRDLARTQPGLQPHIHDFAFVVIIWGIVGARLFHILEYPKEFLADPLSMIFSRGGFTIIGGLIAGTIAGVNFVRKRGFAVLPTSDSAGPAMMLGYAVGRLGCQFSGDGDWGLPANMAVKPSWWPDWFWAQRYEGNIAEVIIPPPGVYPTPIYEALASFVLFLILWRVRKHPFAAGWLFAFYIFLSGVERMLIEQIRINSRYEFFGLSITQAEIFSVCFILAGVCGMLFFARQKITGSNSLVQNSDRT